jgi:hypothetical protein
MSGILPIWRLHRTVALAIALFLIATAVPGRAQQMPDPKQIAGIPLPVADVPVGTIVVRVIRGTLANNIPDQQVELQGVQPVRTVKTDASGRAQFSGLRPGDRVTAVTTVGGERLQSQEITIPGTGGIRVMLVATDAETEKRAADDRQLAASPAQPGVVVLGEQSRFVFEFGDGSLSVFNILQVLNTARTPVQPQRPLVFQLPDGATGASILQDSSPQAKVSGRTVTVAGPFAPGSTPVQFAYSVPYSRADFTVNLTMPIPLSRVIVLAQKGSPEMRLTSAQMTEQREMAAEGNTYIVGQGPAVAANGVLTFEFSNLPHAPLWPRNVALGLAVAILAAGAWFSIRRPAAVPDKTQSRLDAKRSRLYDELTAIEEQHRLGRIDPERYASRRQELVAALERVYAEIDRHAA